MIVRPRRGGESGAGRSRAGGSRVGGGEAAQVDEIVIECKVLHASLERTISDGLEQTAAYMDRCAAAAGHLVVIDRAPGKAWDEKVFHRRMKSRRGVAIDVWGM